MMKKYKALIGYSIIALTFAAFIFYAIKYPELWKQLAKVNVFIVILLFIMNALTLLCIVIILKYTAGLYRVKLPIKDNFRVSSYSAIINFFGPLQSGPGFRAIYLRSKYKLPIKKFIMASLLYYLFFGIYSVAFALIGSAYWRWAVLFLPLAIIISAIIYKSNIPFISKRLKTEDSTTSMHYPMMAKLAIATLVQIILLTITYFIELRTVNGSIALRQAISYAGVANLALFVSLTPGAIGIREAFLLLSQKLHHIAPHNVIAASVLDRSVYISFLGLLFLLTLTLHFREKLTVRKNQQIEIDN